MSECEYCKTVHPEDQIANPHYCIARMGEKIGRLEAALAEKERENREIENQCVLANTLLDAISDIVEGTEPNDFMMSFGVVRAVWDKIAALEKRISDAGILKVVSENTALTARVKELEGALEKIYRSRATHCQGCKEHGQIAKAALKEAGDE